MNRIRIGAFIGAWTMIAGGASAAPRPAPSSLQALGQLEPGEWEVRERGQGGAVKRLCAADLRQLLQIRHSHASCRRFIVTDTARDLVVTYDCGVAGNGRTALRVETPRLAQIETQGIVDGAPFETAVEARRVGACR